MVNWKNSLVAAGVSIPASPESNIHSISTAPRTIPVPTTTVPTYTKAEAAWPTPEILAEEKERPWYFGKISSQFVQIATEHRMASVPLAEASSIAARIINAALAPPQVTPLSSAASSILIEDGENIPPSHVKSLVDMASTAYNEVRASPGFTNYLHYVTSNIKNFQTAPPPTGTQAARMSAAMESALNKLDQTPDGRDAVNSGKHSYEEISHDSGIGGHPKAGGHKNRE